VLGLLLVGIGSLLERASIALLAGALLLIAGLVLWLKRRDYRRTRSEYNDHSLDE
jgi:LPXTG-motif cell wall-anchored protein